MREIRGSEMNNKKILYAWDRGIGKAFLRGNRLLGFWVSEQLGCDNFQDPFLTRLESLLMTLKQ